MSRVWKASLAWAAVLALAGAESWWIVHHRGACRLVVINPLAEPVVVRFGDEEVAVPADGRTSATVREGDVEVEVRAGARLLDRHALHLPVSRAGEAIYSVLGAVPLYQSSVVYVPRNGGGDLPRAAQEQARAFTSYAGERLQLVRANYVLVDPPAELQLPSSIFTVRTRVGIAPGGWATALHLATRRPGGLRAAHQLARRLHHALPDEWVPLAWLLRTAFLLEGPDAAVAWAEEAVAASPASADAHRAYIRAMIQAGRRAELRERYHALAAREPGSPLAAAMRIRALGREDAVAAARAALAAHPDDRQVRLAAANALAAASRPAEAAAAYARLALGPAEENGFVELQVEALLRAARPREAAAAALAAARAEHADAIEAARYLRIARLPGVRAEVEPEEFLRAWTDGKDPAEEIWLRALAGESLPAPQGAIAEDQALEVVRQAMVDPEAALAACESGGPAVVARVPEGVAALLAPEAYRLGRRALFEQLRPSMLLTGEEIAGYVDGGVAPEGAWRLDAAERAALALARERRLRAAGRAVPPEVSGAARGDPARGLAFWAARSWPPAKPAPLQAALVLQP